MEPGPDGSFVRSVPAQYADRDIRGLLPPVTGFVGEQFALPEAVDALRAIRKQPVRGDHVRLAASDPLNLTGALSPGRVAATLGATVVYRDGVPVDDSAPSLAVVA